MSDDLITIEVDGQNIEARKGSMLIEATDAAGNILQFGGDSFVVTAAVPGMINARVDGNPVSFAVNGIPEESNFDRAPVANLYDQIINPDTEPNQSREVRTAQLIEELERPQRVWWWILCLVMLLILVEALVANRTYR